MAETDIIRGEPGKQGMNSIRAGRGIPGEQVKVQMAAFKKKWMKDRGLK